MMATTLCRHSPPKGFATLNAESAFVECSKFKYLYARTNSLAFALIKLLKFDLLKLFGLEVLQVVTTILPILVLHNNTLVVSLIPLVAGLYVVTNFYAHRQGIRIISHVSRVLVRLVSDYVSEDSRTSAATPTSDNNKTTSQPKSLILEPKSFNVEKMVSLDDHPKGTMKSSSSESSNWRYATSSSSSPDDDDEDDLSSLESCCLEPTKVTLNTKNLTMRTSLVSFKTNGGTSNWMPLEPIRSKLPVYLIIFRLQFDVNNIIDGLLPTLYLSKLTILHFSSLIILLIYIGELAFVVAALIMATYMVIISLFPWLCRNISSSYRDIVIRRHSVLCDLMFYEDQIRLNNLIPLFREKLPNWSASYLVGLYQCVTSHFIPSAFAILIFGSFHSDSSPVSERSVKVVLYLVLLNFFPILTAGWHSTVLAKAFVSFKQFERTFKSVAPTTKPERCDSSRTNSNVIIKLAAGQFIHSNTAAAGHHHHHHPIEENRSFNLYSSSDLVIRQKDVVMITGKPASGKTSLVRAILGFMYPVTGGVKIPRSFPSNSSSPPPQPLTTFRSHVKPETDPSRKPIVAYCPHYPSIMHGTIRDNIILLGKFHSQRYNIVLDITQLRVSVDSLSDRDFTYLTPGSSCILTFSQQCQINIARCLYIRFAGIYLFDNPLMDIPKILNQCIVGDEDEHRRLSGETVSLLSGGEDGTPSSCSGATNELDHLIIDLKTSSIVFTSSFGSGNFPNKARNRVHVNINNGEYNTSIDDDVDHDALLNSLDIQQVKAYETVFASLSDAAPLSPPPTPYKHQKLLLISVWIAGIFQCFLEICYLRSFMNFSQWAGAVIPLCVLPFSIWMTSMLATQDVNNSIRDTTASMLEKPTSSASSFSDLALLCYYQAKLQETQVTTPILFSIGGVALYFLVWCATLDVRLVSLIILGVFVVIGVFLYIKWYIVNPWAVEQHSMQVHFGYHIESQLNCDDILTGVRHIYSTRRRVIKNLSVHLYSKMSAHFLTILSRGLRSVQIALAVWGGICMVTCIGINTRIPTATRLPGFSSSSSSSLLFNEDLAILNINNYNNKVLSHVVKVMSKRHIRENTVAISLIIAVLTATLFVGDSLAAVLVLPFLRASPLIMKPSSRPLIDEILVLYQSKKLSVPRISFYNPTIQYKTQSVTMKGIITITLEKPKLVCILDSHCNESFVLFNTLRGYGTLKHGDIRFLTGHSVKCFSSEFLSQFVSYVSSKPMSLSGVTLKNLLDPLDIYSSETTVLSNVLCAVGLASLKDALYENVIMMPNEEVGGGISLSSTQVMLIGLARAILLKPQLILIESMNETTIIPHLNYLTTFATVIISTTSESHVKQIDAGFTLFFKNGELFEYTSKDGGGAPPPDSL